jgi:hypothetical protein
MDARRSLAPDTSAPPSCGSTKQEFTPPEIGRLLADGATA